ncbi:MAG TPA: amidohydrolase family protein [Gemmatimonadales bacterium]|nr:amidohydrolase family protein [Gemmatimonadales bacterium]
MPRTNLAALAFLLLGCATTTRQTAIVAANGVEYRGGLWFDGTRFVATTMYVVDGVFRARAPGHVDSVVDLAGGYVVPPFADAHQHLVDPRIDQVIRAQLGDGIFYIQDQGNTPFLRRIIDPLLNTPISLDFISANQGWTSPGGHPVEVVKRGAAMGGPMAILIRDSLDPGFVMQVESVSDIQQRWPYFLAGKPDFVKVYLLRSEDYDRTRNQPAPEGRRGIDPALVPEIVRLARTAGLGVSAHVYTAADFRTAVNGGVQLIAHLPGGRGADSLYVLTDADAANAARKGVTVITTVTQHQDSALLERLLHTQYATNIAVLRRHHVPLLIGSDLIGGSAVTEIAALARSGLFTNLELLRMWSVTTPRAIFPARRIGRLEEGYEASFLVLRADPLQDITATRAIALRVKCGVAVPMSP